MTHWLGCRTSRTLFLPHLNATLRYLSAMQHDKKTLTQASRSGLCARTDVNPWAMYGHSRRVTAGARRSEGTSSCTAAVEPLAFDEPTNPASVTTSIMQCRYPVAALFVLALTALAAYPAAPPPRPESQQEYWAQFDRRDWSAAILAAEKLVAAAREKQPPRTSASRRSPVASRRSAAGGGRLCQRGSCVHGSAAIGRGRMAAR